jgi:hypothetical protein
VESGFNVVNKALKADKDMTPVCLGVKSLFAKQIAGKTQNLECYDQKIMKLVKTQFSENCLGVPIGNDIVLLWKTQFRIIRLILEHDFVKIFIKLSQ